MVSPHTLPPPTPPGPGPRPATCAHLSFHTDTTGLADLRARTEPLKQVSPRSLDSQSPTHRPSPRDMPSRTLTGGTADKQRPAPQAGGAGAKRPLPRPMMRGGIIAELVGGLGSWGRLVSLLLGRPK